MEEGQHEIYYEEGWEDEATKELYEQLLPNLTGIPVEDIFMCPDTEDDCGMQWPPYDHPGWVEIHEDKGYDSTKMNSFGLDKLMTDSGPLYRLHDYNGCYPTSAITQYIWRRGTL